ncbi:MAG: Manganese ABC transporter substrate-binding lipoprotein [Legionellaceae bacterium]
MIKKIIPLLFILLLNPSAFAKTQVIAAENMYGELAQQLGGDYVKVMSILNNPSQDPHLFSAVPSTAKALANANIIIYNGLDYDSWMKKLLSVKNDNTAEIIEVANLIEAKPGTNPHIWYEPTTMIILAKKITSVFQKMDKQHYAYYQQQLENFLRDYETLQADIYRLRLKFQKTPVIATEPVFNYLADALNLDMHGQALQLSLMNETTPTPSQLKAFEDELTQKQVNLLIYNKQVSEPLVQHLMEIANTAGIPCVGVTETQPVGLTYIQWMKQQLAEIEKALSNAKP